jgi:hypothetical protein
MELSRPPLVVAFELSEKRKAIVADALACVSSITLLHTRPKESARQTARCFLLLSELEWVAETTKERHFVVLNNTPIATTMTDVLHRCDLHGLASWN